VQLPTGGTAKTWRRNANSLQSKGVSLTSSKLLLKSVIKSNAQWQSGQRRRHLAQQQWHPPLRLKARQIRRAHL
jgi:hypothetical protein